MSKELHDLLATAAADYRAAGDHAAAERIDAFIASQDQADGAQGELWAVHAQGPDDLYAALNREDAEKHAAELNALPMPEGISVGAVVIPSPWAPAEHWQYLAEQEREHKDAIEGQRRNLAATLLSQNHELMEARAALAQLSPQCATCNDNGMIGGPSFYAPDEGGVPCPDCSQPSPAPELERPEVVAFLMKPSGEWMPYVGLSRDSHCSHSEPLMTVSQHKRIDAARLASVRVLADEVLELAAQRDAALEKVAELEAQYGGVCLWRQNDSHWFSIECGGSWTRDDTRDSPPSCCINCGKETHILSPFHDGKEWQKAPTFEEGRAKLPKAAAPVAQAGQAGQVPEGWKLVPLVPTLEMKNAGWRDIDRQHGDPEELEMLPIYQAMIAAAPQPAKGE